MVNHSVRQPCLSPARSTVQATGMAQPRYTTLIASTTNRSPSVVASRASANCLPAYPSSTQRSSGAKQVRTTTSCRLVPRLSVASYRNSRSCWRTVWSLRCSHPAHSPLTAVSAQERATTIPRLHMANTVACDRLKCGSWVCTTAVH